MKEFSDSRGQVWRLDLNIATLRKVHKHTGFHLAKLLEPSELFKLQSDDLLLADILWFLVDDQAKERSVSREQFESGLRGQPIMDAVDALLYEYTDFLSDARRGKILQTMWEEFKALNNEITNAVETIASVTQLERQKTRSTP